MYPDPATLTDQQLSIMAMAADMLANYTGDYSDEQHELFTELDRRYPGSSDRTAEQVTGNRMTSWEALAWVVADWQHAGPYVAGTFTVGEAVIVDGAEPARVREPLPGHTDMPGMVWVTINGGDYRGHSFHVDRHRLTRPGVLA